MVFGILNSLKALLWTVVLLLLVMFMFAVCFTSCSIMLADVTLVEYVAVFSALVATLVELYAPCGVNDNLAIPVLSVVALDFALQRVGAYG